MQRYFMLGQYNHTAQEEQALPEPHVRGDWVRYEDAQAEIDRLRGLLARCLTDCEFWDQDKPGNGLDLLEEVKAAVNPPNPTDHRHEGVVHADWCGYEGELVDHDGSRGMRCTCGAADQEEVTNV